MISLEKRVETVKISLQKKSVPNVSVDVAFAIDISGSMTGLYKDGTVQDIIDRVFAMAMNMDPDKSLEVFAFDTGVRHLPPMQDGDYGTYVEKHVRKLVGGGTNYSPVFKEIQQHYGETLVEKKAGFFGNLFGKKDTVASTFTPVKPLYLIFITDGDATDVEATKRIVHDMGPSNVYIQCVGIGHSFRLLESMASEYGHVGFSSMNNINITDEEMYDMFISTEFVNWMKRF